MAGQVDLDKINTMRMNWLVHVKSACPELAEAVGSVTGFYEHEARVKLEESSDDDDEVGLGVRKHN